MEKDRPLVLVIIIIALVFIVLIGVRMSPPPEPAPDYKVFEGFTFVPVDGKWETTIRVSDKFTGQYADYKILFHYSPDELSDIPSMQNTRNESTAQYVVVGAQKIYITTDPDYPSEVVLGGVEIAKVLGQILKKDVDPGLTRNASSIYPVITCDDISEGVRVIELRIGQTNEIKNENGCLIIQGTNSSEVVRVSEKFTFELLKIL